MYEKATKYLNTTTRHGPSLSLSAVFRLCVTGHNLEILQEKLKRFLFGLMSLAKYVEPGLHSTSFFRSMTENRTNTAFLCH